MVKCRSLVPFGACSLGAVSVTPPLTATSSAPPLERTISVLPTGTDSAAFSVAAASLLAAERMIGGLAV